MAAPYGLNVIDSCISCKVREERLFCNLHGASLHELDRIKFAVSYPGGSTLYAEGQPSRGVMILCQGRVKLTMSSAEGKTLIIKIADPGEVLGLSATLSGRPHDTTAESIGPAQVSLIKRDDFNHFVERYPEVTLHAAKELCAMHNTAWNEIRMLGLSQSIPERLARLVLDWDSKQTTPKRGSLKVFLTHEEIAQFLGTSRETVTRALLAWKKRKIVDVKGSTLSILDRRQLEQIADGSSHNQR